MTRIAIVGGGMAGLETAIALGAEPGLNIEVIERGPSSRIEHKDWDSAAYPEDVRTAPLTSFGFNGGVYEGLGGRSRYYHGVMLPVEDEALHVWPSALVTALQGPQGAYANVAHRLKEQFPEMEGMPPEAMGVLGFKHAPQAAILDESSGKFRAYSPLEEALRLARTHESFSLLKGSVQRLIAQPDGRWSIEVGNEGQPKSVRENFDVCVLGASAIGNVKIMAQTIGQEISTPITDHFSVGALVRITSENALGHFRHHRLWAGYLPVPSLGSNIFVGERQRTTDGSRVIDINAIIEQGDNSDDYSTLFARPETAGEASVIARTWVSAQDIDRIRSVSDVISRIAVEIVGGKALTRIEVGELDYDSRESLIRNVPHNDVITSYSFPYGTFEHESSTMPAGSAGVLRVNEVFEVAGLPNVFAVGPGSFTRPGAANPSLTILATSRLVAQTIQDRYV